MNLRLLASVTALLGFASLASAQSLFLPTGAGTAEGPSSTGWPWNRNALAVRIQYIYDSTHFTGQSVGFPILVTGAKWRANASSTTWAGTTYNNVEVSASTAAVDQAAVTATFASNRGADYSQVYSGPVVFAGGTGNGAGIIGPDVVDVTFNTPFLYDPTAGDDFLVEVAFAANSWTGGATTAMDAFTTGSLTSRVYNLTDPNSATGTVQQNVGLVMELVYVPAAGLYAGFAADVTSGPSPLSVNFTDSSFSSDPGGITSWAWDFDGDGIVDSTLQNPTFVYTNCGTYNVTLTVTDGTHAPNSLTRTAYIATDNIQAGFTSGVVGPLTVQFTDTSNMPASSWAWDLDGDGITDSTVQNPVWVYPNTSPVNVTLTVTRLCSSPSSITQAVRAAQELSHNVAANNGLSPGASVYFDLNVLNPAGMGISSMDIIGSIANTPFTVEMWVKPGTHVAFEGTAAEWVLSGIASGTTVGTITDVSSAAFPQAIYLPPGLHGIKLRYLGVGPRYQNLTAVTTIGNADATMTVGVSRGSSVADPWAGSNIQLRAFSGTLYYSTHNIAGLAGFGQFAPGCAGTLPTATLTGNLPQLGQTFTVNADNLPQSLAIMMIGFSNTVSGFGPLPLNLAAFGATGCFGRVSPDATNFLIGASNTASWVFGVPAAPALSGLTLYQQALVLDAAANAGGFVTSNAAAFQIGN